MNCKSLTALLRIGRKGDGIQKHNRGRVFSHLFVVIVIAVALACQPDPPVRPNASSWGAIYRAQTLAPDNNGIKLTHNLDSAFTSNIDQIHPDGETGFDLTAAGVLIGQWDDGSVRDTHIDLIGRVSNRDNNGLSNHATQVAGTLIGDGSGNSAARGMAPGAELWSFSWQFDVVELGNNAPFLNLSNHAYGFASGWYQNPACPDLPTWIGGADNFEDPAFGKYGRAASDIDAVVGETDLIVVWTAGNERADSGAAPEAPHYHHPSCEQIHNDTHAQEALIEYDTISGAATAKNVITVGSAADITNRPFETSDIRPLDYSSYGPMDDSRIKPELVASGGDLYSTSSFSDDAYGAYRGSSASAPVVAGSVALLVEKYRQENQERDPRAAEIKALLVHTAVEAGDDPGPEYSMGFGLLDARAAADLIDRDGAQPQSAKHIRVAVLEDGQSEQLTTADAIEPGAGLRVTLAWVDPQAPPNTREVDDTTGALVNDLDLTLIAPDGDTRFYPWSLDAAQPDEAATRSGPNRVDNLEVVDVDGSDNTWDGEWTIRVEMNQPLRRGKPQAFALVSDAPLSAPQNPVISAPRQIAMVSQVETESITVKVPIANLGGGTLSWEVVEDIPWLSVEPASGTAPDGFEVIADTEVLTEKREHLGVLNLKSSDPSGDRYIGVRLCFACEPDCSASQCGPDPVCGKPCGRCAQNEYCDQQGQCQLLTQGCPSADLSGQLGAALVSGTTLETENNLEGECGGDDTDERAFFWSAPEAGWYTFSTHGSDFDTVIYLRESDCDGVEFGCNDNAYDRTSALNVALQAGEEVIAVIDGASEYEEGDFVLNINKTSCPDGDLGSRLGGFTISRSDIEGVDVSAGSCGGRGGADAAFTWTAPQEGLYTFSVSGSETSEGDFIYLLEEICEGEELECGQESLEVSLDQDQQVVVVVDGFEHTDAERNSVKLNITSPALSCEGNCGATPNDGLCYCDAICFALEDCCVDVCSECDICESTDDCPDGQCQADACGDVECEICQVCENGSCISAEDGVECDDDNPCTESDICHEGTCSGIERECDDSDPCTSDKCDETTGQCAFTPIACPGDSSVSENPDAGQDAEVIEDASVEERDQEQQTNTGCGCRVVRRYNDDENRFLWILFILLVFSRRRIREKP